MKNYLTLALVLLGIQSFAQLNPTQIYFTSNDVKVYVEGQPIPAAWSGGLNAPQFSVADLNNDGKKDLAIYDKYATVKTFINTGVNGNPNYVYDASYEANFPGDKSRYQFMFLLDYNQDNVPDLFVNGGPAFDVFIGYYDNNNRLAFNHYKMLYYPGFAGPVNALVQGDDIPAIVDMDGDGDLDFMTYTFAGATLTYYKNCAKEHGLPKDSIEICLADNCWGRLYQYSSRTMNLGYSCWQGGTSSCKGCPQDGSGNKTTDGANTLCLLDYDNDGDMDILNGNILYSDIQLQLNGKADYGAAVDTITSQDTIWSSNGVPLTMRNYPGAYHVDIDQDGDKDLLFSPSLGIYENYRSVAYYKNTGTATAANYVYQSDTFLMASMIDVGGNSRPVFYDYNRDGKKDMFIGSTGYYQNNGSFKTTVAYYENISEKGYPTLKKITNDFMGLGAQGLKGSSVTFGDIDNDGKDDMVVGQTDGTVLLFRNTAANNNVQPQWSATGEVVRTSQNKILDVGNKAAPVVYDVDTDGKADLVIGNEAGFLHFYKNTGTSGAAAFDSVTNKLGGIRLVLPTSSSASIVPYIGAIDDSKKEYLLLGTKDGTVWKYNYEPGNPGGTFALEEQDYQSINAGPFAAPVAEDIDGDGMYELLVGNTLGGIKLYKQLFNVSVTDLSSDKKDIKVYPNPAGNYVTVSWDGVFTGKDVSVELVSVTGQKLLRHNCPATQSSIRLPLSDVPSGVYYCVIGSSEKTVVSPVTVIR